MTQSLADVPRALDRLLKQGVGALAINGGDGTLGAAIAHLERRGVQLPLIPILGGTNNAVAKDVRAAGGVDQVAARLRLCARRGDDLSRLPVIERQTLRVTRRTAGGRETPLGIGFIFASGLIVRFTEAYYAGPWLGPPQVARVVLDKLGRLLWPAAARPFWAFEPNQMAIDDAALDLPAGAQLAFVSTIDTQILFFRPFPTKASTLRGFNVLVNALPAPAIARDFFRLVLGRYHGPGHWTVEADRFALSGTRKVFLDGELHDVDPSDTLLLSPGPRVRFLQLR